MRRIIKIFFNEEDMKWWKSLSIIRRMAIGYVGLSMALSLVLCSSESLVLAALSCINLAAAVIILKATEE